MSGAVLLLLRATAFGKKVGLAKSSLCCKKTNSGTPNNSLQLSFSRTVVGGPFARLGNSYRGLSAPASFRTVLRRMASLISSRRNVFNWFAIISILNNKNQTVNPVSRQLRATREPRSGQQQHVPLGVVGVSMKRLVEHVCLNGEGIRWIWQDCFSLKCRTGKALLEYNVKNASHEALWRTWFLGSIRHDAGLPRHTSTIGRRHYLDKKGCVCSPPVNILVRTNLLQSIWTGCRAGCSRARLMTEYGDAYPECSRKSQIKKVAR